MQAFVEDDGDHDEEAEDEHLGEEANNDDVLSDFYYCG